MRQPSRTGRRLGRLAGYGAWIGALVTGAALTWETSRWEHVDLLALLTVAGAASDLIVSQQRLAGRMRGTGAMFAVFTAAALAGSAPALSVGLVLLTLSRSFRAFASLPLSAWLSLMTAALTLHTLIALSGATLSDSWFCIVVLPAAVLAWACGAASSAAALPLRARFVTDIRGIAAPAVIGGSLVTAAVYTYVEADLVALALMVSGLLAFNALLSRMARSEAELNEQRDRAQRYLRVAANFMVVLDQDAHVQFLNERAAKTLGREADGAIGQNWFDLVCNDETEARTRRAGYRQLQATNAGTIVHQEMKLTDAAGRERIFAFNISPFRDANDEFVGVVASGQDITEQRELEEQRIAAERLKDEFFALVSHELRTPLSSIIGYLDLIMMGEAGEIDPLMEEYFGVIERNSSRLLRLVEDLLFAAQLEAGRLSLSMGSCDLAQVTRDAVQAAQPRAEAGDVQVVADLPERVDFHGDAGRLGQLCDNLISNAIKYTPAGGSVTVRVLNTGESWRLEVQDTGIGMSEEDQERLFSRFFRASSATQAAIPGVGLGLTICKAIAEGHGGSIGQRSRLGEGTVFFVDLPHVPSSEDTHDH